MKRTLNYQIKGSKLNCSGCRIQRIQLGLIWTL